MNTRKALVCVLPCLATLVGTGALAESCAYLGASENFNSIAYCVSSVLSSQAGNSYGPENLFDFERSTAWCEGARGSGTGQVLTLRIDGGGPFRRLLIENGYGKSDRVFYRNARPRTIEIRTDTGLNFRHVLEDRWNERWVELPSAGQYRVLQIRVLDVYTGTHFQDMCISTILVDFDHERYLEWQKEGLKPQQSPPMPDKTSEPSWPSDIPSERPGFEDLPALPKL
ncbi:NADase-type glycan-binding domain-containing protein [uncultured Cohaesibacter sp.]|uniref:NADase-type glycan-binding domain-containing protein n=1 Tax=uncultured Cohaesibacter sp. TaxID=1002546 RepID=UPI0029C8502F|nr:hypothetical protein [uncultured Cohaesibacter sp.]